MEAETLKIANVLLEEISNCEEQLNRIKYTQSENVAIRKSYWNFNGGDDEIEIPENLFRIIGKLIKAEYTEKTETLKAEFKKL